MRIDPSRPARWWLLVLFFLQDPSRYVSYPLASQAVAILVRARSRAGEFERGFVLDDVPLYGLARLAHTERTPELHLSSRSASDSKSLIGFRRWVDLSDRPPIHGVAPTRRRFPCGVVPQGTTSYSLRSSRENLQVLIFGSCRRSRESRGHVLSTRLRHTPYRRARPTQASAHRSWSQ
jgi:hypothetical protein